MESVFVGIPVEPDGNVTVRLVDWFLNIKKAVGASVAVHRHIFQSKPVVCTRNLMVHEFLKTPCDYLLTIDADAVPDTEGFLLLLEAIRRPDVDAVGGWSCMVTDEGPKPCVQQYHEGAPATDHPCLGLPAGLHRLPDGGIGAHCLMVKRKTLEAMRDFGVPWFKDRIWDGSMEPFDLRELLDKYADSALREKLEAHICENRFNEKWGRRWQGQDVWFPVAEDTKVLGADWRWRDIAEYEAGDQVMGFDEESRLGRNRRFSRATVLGTVRKKLPRVRIITDDHDIITTREHPWVAKRNTRNMRKVAWGWMPAGELEPGMVLASIAQRHDNPDVMSEDYCAGYVQGLMQSDGNRRGGKNRAYTVRMKDTEPLERFATSLSVLGVESVRGPMRWDGDPNHAPMHGAGVYRRCFADRMDAIVLDSSAIQSRQFAAGYLAGMFDGDGSNSDGTVRIYNQSEMKKDRVADAARLLSLPFSRRDDGLLLYGQDNTFRFFQNTLPSLSRRTEPKGQGVGGQEVHHRPVVIRAIETLEPDDVMCLGTTSGTFIADGLATHNCVMCLNLGLKLWVDTRVFWGHVKQSDIRAEYLEVLALKQRLAKAGVKVDEEVAV